MRLQARHAAAARDLVEKREVWPNPPGATGGELKKTHAHQPLQRPPAMARRRSSQTGRSRLRRLRLARQRHRRRNPSAPPYPEPPALSPARE